MEDVRQAPAGEPIRPAGHLLGHGGELRGKGPDLPKGTIVKGPVPNTGRTFVGFLRGRNRYGDYIVDGERWSGDSEHMPRQQAILFTVEPVEGEGAETIMYETAARAILAGQSTREAEVADIAKRTKASKAKVGERLDAAIAEQKAAARQAEKASGKKAVAAKPAAKQRAEHVEPKEFADLRDSLGLTNKEAAAANAEAGLGSTLSRITELTHSKGASRAIFDKVEAAWKSYAAKLKKEGTPR